MARESGTTPAPKRECGTCTLCCKALPVEGIVKEAGQWCPHCVPGAGCGIYERRPQSCRDFDCLWLRGHFAEGDRPDRLDAVFWSARDNVRTYPDGRKIPFVIVSERHDGAALANERARRIILELLRREAPVAIGKGTLFKLLALDHGGRIVVAREAVAQPTTGMTVEGRPTG